MGGGASALSSPSANATARYYLVKISS